MKSEKNNGDSSCAKPAAYSGAAFLLAQVGAHAASKFAGRLVELKLVPAHAGILRILGVTPNISQQRLAAILGTLPSRLVALVDELESKELLERRPHRSDRRSYALHLTPAGKSMLQAIGRVARQHQQTLLAGLSEDEQERLAALLQRVADQQGLTPRVHPGYRSSEVPGSAEKL